MADKNHDTNPASNPDVKYVRNDLGFIHSVTPEHFDEVLSMTVGNGRKVLLPGWEEVDEATARKEQPTLFGALDPNVRLNLREMQDVREREKFVQEHPELEA